MGTNNYSKQIAYYLDFCNGIGFKEKNQITINNILDDNERKINKIYDNINK